MAVRVLRKYRNTDSNYFRREFYLFFLEPILGNTILPINYKIKLDTYLLA